ncbi:MAG: alpha-glucuronidase family glycosyl hydrolase [Pirellulales bacterium]
MQVRHGEGIANSGLTYTCAVGLLATGLWVVAIPVAVSAPSASAAEELSGLVGRWEFDDGTGRDLSGHGHDAVLGEAQIYSLGKNRACLRITPDGEPLRIPATPDSPLAIARGTIALWLNLAWSDNVDVLEFSNQAILFRVYRRHLQPRFRGDSDFKYSSGIIDFDWPKYDMREWAFYPHDRAAVGDSEWHHFVLAYDDRDKQIIGWRDGDRISTVDLSTTKMEPLRRRGLKEIVTGEGLAGFVDDIRVYNTVLTDNEVRAVFDATQAIYADRRDTIPTDRKMEVYEYQEADRSLYRAWLQRDASTARRPHEVLRRIVAEGENSTVHTAAKELADAVQSMFAVQPAIESLPAAGAKIVLGTLETSSWIHDRSEDLGIDRVKDDGFIIKAINDGDEQTLVVAGRVPAGVIFGAFDLIRRIQLGQNADTLDVLENPQIPIRIVDHWANFRGFPQEDWYGRKPGSTKNSSRHHSIFSWEDLRTGETKLIRDWVRLMSSAGWNAISPSEINWGQRNNFLEHLGEVETLAGICRDYGIKLYWSPSYLLAIDQATADKLYSRIPDFGGYVLKLGSEKQNGDPRPQMVNRIADTLKPYGGYALVRGFVYGNGRYASEPYRNLIPYDVLAAEDGHFRDNVIIAPKGSPLDWDFSAPIPALDGAFQQNLSGSELVIDKNWPVSWVEKWKWWLEQDNRRSGPGSLNKFDVDCIMGVSMISPAPAWSVSALNMVNYYGLGRLSWNPDLSVDEIYTEWIRQTFGDDPQVLDTIKTILLLSDDAARKMYLYRGYRGVWIDTDNRRGMVQKKSTHSANSRGIGATSPQLQERTLAQYAPGLRAIYGDPILGEEFLPSFRFAEYDHRLSTGRTVIQDFYANMDEAVQLAAQLPELWKQLEGKVDDRRFATTLESLNEFVETLKKQRQKQLQIFETVSGRKAAGVKSQLTAAAQASVGVYNVRDYGAKSDHQLNNAPAINAAITTCSGAGGGTVFVPAGIYGCGTIRLKSNVTLALDTGAVLRALPGAMDPWEPNPHDQGLMDSAYYHWHASLICGEELVNIRILGPGTLDGTFLTRSSKVPSGTGDKAIALKRCRNVDIINLKIQEGGHYAILATGCEDMRIDNVTVKTSRDGLNLSQCRNVLVANSHIDAVRYEDGQPAGGDDAIKLGSELSLGAAQPTENIVVRNCYLASGCNALQFGTETVGDFRNIRFENIRIVIAGKAGISVTSNDGSVIDNVHFKDITMEKTFVPIFIKVSDVGRVPKGTYQRGAIRNVTLEDITSTDGRAPMRGSDMPCVIWGKPQSPIENIEFKNVRLIVKGGRSAEEPTLSPRENDERFPQDVGALPAYAAYVRHVKNIRFVNCDFGFEANDDRSALVAADVAQLVVEKSSLEQGLDAPSPIVGHNGSQVSVVEHTADKTATETDAKPDVDVVGVASNVQRQTTLREEAPLSESAKIGPNSAPNSGTVYEAEQADFSGAELATKRDGFTGTGYVDYRERSGDYIEWKVRATSTGEHRLTFRYALKKEARHLELKVNGAVVGAALMFPSTGDWKSWEAVETVASLKEGTNTVRLSTSGSNGGNVDYLKVEPVVP